MPQDLVYYQQVLHFMKWQLRRPELPRMQAATMAVIGFGRGRYTAERVLHQERNWVTRQTIAHANRGRHAKAVCMLKDEGTALAVREYLLSADESLYSYLYFLGFHLFLKSKSYINFNKKNCN
jgi:hypothetical protein